MIASRCLPVMILKPVHDPVAIRGRLGARRFMRSLDGGPKLNRRLVKSAGLFNRESREFRAESRGPGPNVMIGFAPRSISSKTESAEHPSGMDVTPCQKGKKRKKPRDFDSRRWA